MGVCDFCDDYNYGIKQVAGNDDFEYGIKQAGNDDYNYDKGRSPCVQKPSQFSLFRAHFSKKMLPSIAMAAADCCAGDKDHATRYRPPARAGVQACRGARASSSKIPVVERCAWRPVHKRKAEDAWSCARRRRRRSCSSRSA